MSLLNNLKDFFVPTDVIDENDDVKQTTEEPAKSESSYSSPVSSTTTSGSTRSASSSYTGQHEERKSTYSASKPVSSVSASCQNSFSSPTLQVILVKPTEYTDAKKIADHLMGGRTVVLVLEDATEAVRRRIIDFLIGVAYAMNGNLKPIANETYIITPHDVGLVDQLVSELGKPYSTVTDNITGASIL